MKAEEAAFQDPSVCAEPGRAMFYQYVGRWFFATPRLKELPSGRACAICGNSGARLWLTDSKEPLCLAQQAITAKRAARKDASEPMVPPADFGGSTNFSDGNMVIAGPHTAMVVTKLLPAVPLPDTIEAIFSDKGSILRASKRLIDHPPKPPFVATVFAKQARYPMHVTIDASRVILNGQAPQVIDRPRLTALLAIAERTGTDALKGFMELRERLAGGGPPRKSSQQDDDQAALLALRAGNTMTMPEFRTLPLPRSSEAALLRLLLG